MYREREKERERNIAHHKTDFHLRMLCICSCLTSIHLFNAYQMSLLLVLMCGIQACIKEISYIYIYCIPPLHLSISAYAQFIHYAILYVLIEYKYSYIVCLYTCIYTCYVFAHTHKPAPSCPRCCKSTSP